MQTYDLYDGQVQLHFDHERHAYSVTHNGETKPTWGVTSLINLPQPWMGPWACKMMAEELLNKMADGPIDEIAVDNAKSAFRRAGKDAAGIGTLMHQFAEDVALYGDASLPINPLARTACEAFLEWWTGNDIEVISAERKIYSLSWDYAGTVDLIAVINGRTVIADYKTSARVNTEMYLQTAAYQEAYEEETGEEIDARMILRFGKDGKFEAKEMTEFDRDLNAFVNSMNLTKALKEIK